MNSTVCVNGIMMPAPAAWTIRPTIRTENPGANAQMIVPVANKPIATKNRLRVENFPIKNAVIGIMTPLTSIKTVVSHCAVFAEMLKSSMICGKAVASRVWLRIATKTPAISTARKGPFAISFSVSFCRISAIASSPYDRLYFIAYPFAFQIFTHINKTAQPEGSAVQCYSVT